MKILKNLLGPVLHEIRIDLAEIFLFWAVRIVPKDSDEGYFMAGCINTYFHRMLDYKAHKTKGRPDA